MSVASDPGTIGKMLVNARQPLILSVFMLALAYSAFALGYLGAAIFFAIITVVFVAILYRKIKSERVRAKFGEYRIR